MEIIKILLVTIEVLSSVLLVGVILLQKSKSEGLGLAFGSGVGETLFGSRAGNVLTKITVTLGVVFLVTTTLLATVYTAGHERSIIDSRTAPLPPMEAAPPPRQQSATAPAAPQQQTAPAPTLMPGALDETPAPSAAAPAAAPAPAPAPVEETKPE